MSEHHGVHESDAASEPRRPDMGTGVQDMHREKDQTEIVFSDSESAEEAIGN